MIKCGQMWSLLLCLTQFVALVDVMIHVSEQKAHEQNLAMNGSITAVDLLPVCNCPILFAHTSHTFQQANIILSSVFLSLSLSLALSFQIRLETRFMARALYEVSICPVCFFPEVAHWFYS